MINHLRTLLMNVTADAVSPVSGYLADEIIPPGYKALELPTYLDSVRSHLFGTNPDRPFLNYRVRQLLAVVHSSPLEHFVTKLDKRLTYGFTSNTLADESIFRPVVRMLVGGTTDNLTVLGRPDPPDVLGRMYHMLNVDVLSHTTLSVQRLTTPLQKMVLDFAVGDILPLTGTGYSFRLASNNVGQLWRIDMLNRPQYELGTVIANLGTIGEPVLDQLFGITKDEPYLTFRNLWTQNKETPLRVSAIVLALAYRTEERRQRQGS